jgi:lysophospholipase L1-like esterase
MKLSSLRGALLIATAALLFSAASATAHPKLDYVALGDSYAAAPGVTAPLTVSTPPGCGQSSLNYPHVLASWGASFHLTVNLTDVTCGGAVTANMTAPQTTAAGINAPQFDALSHKTDAVTLTIGGNDIGFGTIVATCISPTNTGTPCQDRYIVGGVDTLRARIDALAPTINNVLDGIKARSPHAGVVVVGYPDILPDDGTSCWPQMPYTASDVAYMNGVEKYLNSMLQGQARKNHADFADSYRASVGKDSCKSPEVRFVEPLQPVNPAIPVHPNASGEEAMAKATLLALLH